MGWYASWLQMLRLCYCQQMWMWSMETSYLDFLLNSTPIYVIHGLICIMVAESGCMNATRWNCDQCKHHIWIACKILQQFDIIHDLICLMVAERGCVTATMWGCDQWKPYNWIACKILHHFDVLAAILYHK